MDELTSPGVPFHPSMRLTPDQTVAFAPVVTDCDYCSHPYDDGTWHPGLNLTPNGELTYGGDEVTYGGNTMTYGV